MNADEQVTPEQRATTMEEVIGATLSTLHYSKQTANDYIEACKEVTRQRAEVSRLTAERDAAEKAATRQQRRGDFYETRADRLAVYLRNTHPESWPDVAAILANGTVHWQEQHGEAVASDNMKLSAEVSRLTAERDAATRRYEELDARAVADLLAFNARLDEVEARHASELSALRGALTKYGRHKANCNSLQRAPFGQRARNEWLDRGCTCGLDAALGGGSPTEETR